MSGSDRPSVPAALRAELQQEPWARALGVEYLALAPGYCRVALDLAPHMLNHQGAPHGGVVFSLADIALGAASNTDGGRAVALTATISFLAAAAPGSRLIAECRERRRGRRAGFYDVTVTTDAGRVTARLTAVTHRIATPDA